MTRSMLTVMEDLELESPRMVHAGEATFPLAARVRAAAAKALLEEV